MPETEGLPAKKLLLPIFTTDTTKKTTIASLSQRLTSWFERDQADGKLKLPAESRDLLVAEAPSSASITDWESTGFLNFGHWRKFATLGNGLCEG